MSVSVLLLELSCAPFAPLAFWPFFSGLSRIKLLLMPLEAKEMPPICLMGESKVTLESRPRLADAEASPFSRLSAPFLAVVTALFCML